MSFKDRGLTSQTTTKDGKRFFDVTEKKMMEILNIPVTIRDFETGVRTKNGGDRYAVLFTIDGQPDENGRPKLFKVITNSFTLKSVLDQAREYDDHLEELREKEAQARERYGSDFSVSRMGLSAKDLEILTLNRPVLPQQTCIKRRDLGGGKYDYQFD